MKTSRKGMLPLVCFSKVNRMFSFC